VAGYYSATRPHRAAAPLADFLTAAYTNDQSLGNQNRAIDSEGQAVTVTEIEQIATCELVKSAPDPRLVEVVRMLARRAARQWLENTEAQS
jgi:hypothetical protein